MIIMIIMIMMIIVMMIMIIIYYNIKHMLRYPRRSTPAAGARSRPRRPR